MFLNSDQNLKSAVKADAQEARPAPQTTRYNLEIKVIVNEFKSCALLTKGCAT